MSFIRYTVVVKYLKDDKMDPDVIAWVMKHEFDGKAAKLDKRYNDDGDPLILRQSS
jgi:hypothetical protein